MKRIIVALLILIISALAAVMYNFTFPNIGILKNIYASFDAFGLWLQGFIPGLKQFSEKQSFLVFWFICTLVIILVILFISSIIVSKKKKAIDKEKNKEEVLARLLDIYAPKLSVVFCNTKKQVDLLVQSLLGRGYFAAALHGDLKQEQRDRVMQGFRSGKTDILVATDVAARGIDVDEVEAVFNYDLPQDDEYYVHRIGRTGRAGREGRAFSFVTGKEVYKLKEIQRYCKTKIYLQKVPSLNDVVNTKMEKMLDEIEYMIENEDLTSMINAVEARLNESDYTAMDMAAAFLKMCSGQNDIAEKEEFDFGDTGAGESGMVRLFINIGKKQKARPGDILGAIAGETGLNGKVVGTIDMYDKYTFVEVPREYAPEVLKAMKNVKIKGKTVAVEPANRK